MIKKFTLLFLFLASLCLGLFAQEKTINLSGKVTGGDDNTAVEGVSIYIRGTNKGTKTDKGGFYSLNNVPANAVLVFSALGFVSKTIPLAGQTKMDVVLESKKSDLEQLVVVGSRSKPRTSLETPVPVDVISLSDIQKNLPQVNIGQILNYAAPSFTSNVQNIADGTDHVDPASLRGLGPDQVLVLINGKRRHTSSLINTVSSFGRGNVGTDLNTIPTSAIDRIEVLRDGAAAQYGSDAIAGVINIILKKEINHLNVNITTGTNQSKNANSQTGGFDGATTNLALNYGIPLGGKGGLINFTGDFDVRAHFNRMKEDEGQIFNGYNSIEYLAYKDGKDISNLSLDDIKYYANRVTSFGEGRKAAIQKASLEELKNPKRPDLLAFDNTQGELQTRKLSRSDFNMRVGQSAMRGGRVFANLTLPIDDNGTELYAFSGMSLRNGNSAGFYRLPYQARSYTPAYINGFLPEILTTINDKSLAVGIKGKVKNWDVDLSNTFGQNGMLFTINNSINSSLGKQSPTTFDAGGFTFSQNTANLDLSRKFDDVLSGLNIALGSEYRMERYQIFAGELPSYASYTPEGTPITLPGQKAPTDFFGDQRPGSSQGFPGFQPSNEVDRGRSSVAGYVDLEADITKSLLIGAAGRYENYSDFGSTLNFKLASRIKIIDNLNFRLAGNTGFRAPSLQQLYFSSTATQFVSGNPEEKGTFSNDSRVARLIGIPKLKQETSKSVSFGLTAKIPSANLTFSADAYFVAIENRIVLTDSFSAEDEKSELYNILRQANATTAAFFCNAIDTESKGIDMVITHEAQLSNVLRLKSDLSATLSQTKRVGDIHASEVLKRANLLDTYFSESSKIFLEKSVPGAKGNLTLNLMHKKFNVLFRNSYFGEVTEPTDIIKEQQVFGSKVITDLSLGYNFMPQLTLTVGANNLLDIYPDRVTIPNNYFNGRFPWSIGSVQYGIAGRFLFARVTVDLK